MIRQSRVGGQQSAGTYKPHAPGIAGTAASLRLALATLIAAAAAAGCAGTPEEEEKTVYYRCADTARFGVKALKNERIELSRSPNRYTLKKAESASGVKYASAKASFWNQGEEALIEVGDKRYSGCRLDSVQSDPGSVSRLQRLFIQGISGGTGGQR
jgi:membrane-bound inhibitor of C-type lysozyme